MNATDIPEKKMALNKPLTPSMTRHMRSIHAAHKIGRVSYMECGKGKQWNASTLASLRDRGLVTWEMRARATPYIVTLTPFGVSIMLRIYVSEEEGGTWLVEPDGSYDSLRAATRQDALDEAAAMADDMEDEYGVRPLVMEL